MNVPYRPYFTGKKKHPTTMKNVMEWYGVTKEARDLIKMKEEQDKKRKDS